EKVGTQLLEQSALPRQTVTHDEDVPTVTRIEVLKCQLGFRELVFATHPKRLVDPTLANEELTVIEGQVRHDFWRRDFAPDHGGHAIHRAFGPAEACAALSRQENPFAPSVDEVNGRVSYLAQGTPEEATRPGDRKATMIDADVLIETFAGCRQFVRVRPVDDQIELLVHRLEDAGCASSKAFFLDLQALDAVFDHRTDLRVEVTRIQVVRDVEFAQLEIDEPHDVLGDAQ